MLNLTQSNYITTQIQLPLNLEVIFKADDEVITFNNLVKDIDFNKFFFKKDIYNTETRGRKKKSRANILKAILFAFSIGIRSTRDIESLCRHDTRFMFLLDGIDPPSHTTINNTINSLVANIDDVLVEINKKIMEYDQEVDPNIVYIDGTKLEAYANKYTFVWKKAVLKYRDKLILKIKKILPKLNELLSKYDYPVIENKEYYDTSELLDIVIVLTSIIDKEGIPLVYGKGKRKDEVQRLFDAFEEYHNKMLEYSKHLKIIGENRNSYSKTDHDATFMRMKDDYMRNGQLKAGYNMQIAIANGYAMAIELYQDRADFSTFIPFLNHFDSLYGFYPKYPVADAGYGSFDNYRFCMENNIELFQKYSMFSKEKEKKYKNNPFNKYNFKKDEEGNYICPNNKKLVYVYDKKMKNSVYENVYNKVYKCFECDVCPLREKCTTSKTGRTISVNEEFETYKQIVRNNLESEEGIKLRVNRSIQVEGAFGMMKENMRYRRFSRRSKAKARLEAILVAIGMNISKFHNRKYRVIQ
ncbi:MAG: IS1182 family transposase [Bacilli bacterium]|jgi:transposase|nr:IS1182 family transposase [Acholeplasmataceae bacterium]